MNFWLSVSSMFCFVITNFKFEKLCFIKDYLRKHICITGWCLVHPRNPYNRPNGFKNLYPSSLFPQLQIFTITFLSRHFFHQFCLFPRIMVSDPHWFNAFFLIANPNPDPYPDRSLFCEFNSNFIGNFWKKFYF